MSRASKACDISRAVRGEVTERDGGRCIICGSIKGIQIAHYVSRARLGLGIPQNLACMCYICHQAMDNGKFHAEYQKAFEHYLQMKYDGWDEKNITYRKWR